MDAPRKTGFKTSPAKGSLQFTKLNIYTMLAGILLIAIGYLLMRGGRTLPNQFDVDEIFSFTRITLAPLLILLGFAVVAWGILRIEKKV